MLLVSIVSIIGIVAGAIIFIGEAKGVSGQRGISEKTFQRLLAILIAVYTIITYDSLKINNFKPNTSTFLLIGTVVSCLLYIYCKKKEKEVLSGIFLVIAGICLFVLLFV